MLAKLTFHHDGTQDKHWQCGVDNGFYQGGAAIKSNDASIIFCAIAIIIGGILCCFAGINSENYGKKGEILIFLFILIFHLGRINIQRAFGFLDGP